MNIDDSCGKKRGCVLTKFYIYCLIDPLNGQIRYIGYTKNIQKRFYGHISKCKSKRNNSRKDNWIRHLLNEKVKPIIEIIDEFDDPDSIDTIKFWEMHYISLFKSWGFDLTNATDGGDGIICAESRKKISEKLKGNKNAEGTIGWSKGKKFLNNEIGTKRGTKFTVEHKNNLRGPHFGRRIPILQYSLTDEFIREWDSATQASIELGISSSGINSVCNKARNKSGGFIWKYSHTHSR